MVDSGKFQSEDFTKVQQMFPQVSRETWEKLQILVEILNKWQTAINLIAPKTLPNVWIRHIADSLQLFELAPQAQKWVDLGSGGGFPGLVIAAMLAQQHDSTHYIMHLVESDQRKCVFLREAARLMNVNVCVHNGRIENILSSWNESVDVVTARALSSLNQLIFLAFPLLEKGCPGLFPKGHDAKRELTEAAKYWNIKSTLIPSKTDPSASIVRIDSLLPS